MFCLRAHVEKYSGSSPEVSGVLFAQVEKYSGSSPEVSGVLFACSCGEVQW